MANTTSPNMSLVIPSVISEPGPTYALDVNASLTLIDQHDHSPGKGVQITPAGININTTFPMNDNLITQLQALVFQTQVSPSTLAQSLSVAPGSETPPQQDLWYTPDTGIPIQITENGIVKTTASSIPGESYAAGTFFWTQAQDSLPTNPASFDIGSITLRPNIAATSFGVTIVPPTAATYNFNLPASLPASRKFLTIDNSGNVGDVVDVDNSTIVITSNTIQVPAGGITTTQIATGGVQTSNIANGAVTQVKRASLNQQTSRPFTCSRTVTSSGSVTLTSDFPTNTFASPGSVTFNSTGNASQKCSVNDTFTFTTTGTLPTGLTAGTTYYVISTSITINQITFSATMGGPLVTFTGAGTGTTTIHFNNVLVNVSSIGRPIAIALQAPFQGQAEITLSSGSSLAGVFARVQRFLPTFTSLADVSIGTGTSQNVPAAAYNYIDVNTTADTYQYQLAISNESAATVTFTVSGVLIAYEL